MSKRQGANLDRRKLLADPIMMGTIIVLITFLTIFIVYPLAILLVDAVYSNETGLTMEFFCQIFCQQTISHSDYQYTEGGCACRYPVHSDRTSVCLC